MKKILILMLALLMLLSCFALTSCQNNEKQPEETETNEEHTQPADENSQLDIPESVKYDGEFSHYEIRDCLLTKDNMLKETGCYGYYKTREDVIKAIEENLASDNA